MGTGPSAVGLLEAGIEALTHADAARLEALAEAAREVQPAGSPEERRKVVEQLRMLERLIALTQRNLRVLRATTGYESLR